MPGRVAVAGEVSAQWGEHVRHPGDKVQKKRRGMDAVGGQEE